MIEQVTIEKKFEVRKLAFSIADDHPVKGDYSVEKGKDDFLASFDTNEEAQAEIARRVKAMKKRERYQYVGPRDADPKGIPQGEELYDRIGQKSVCLYVKKVQRELSRKNMAA